MLSIFAHEAVWLSESDHSKKEKAGKKRNEEHSPLGFPLLATYHGGESGGRKCPFTVDISAHTDSVR